MAARAGRRALERAVGTVALALLGCTQGGVPPAPSASPPSQVAPTGPSAPAPAPSASTVVVVSRTAVALAGAPAPVVPLPADASLGIDAAFKRSGPNDLFIVPLAAAFAAERATGRLRDRLVIVVDPETPYRVVVEVLFTAGQSEVGEDLLCEGGLAGRQIVTHPPRPGRPEDPPDHGLHLSTLVVAEGVSMKASGGNVAPGCDAVGKGVTVPRAGGRIDGAAVRACAAKLRGARPEFAGEDTVTIAAAPATPAREVFDVADALRGDNGELFPKVWFAISR